MIYKINKVTKKYINNKKNRKTKLYNLYGGSEKDAFIYFNENFDSILTHLTKDKDIGNILSSSVDKKQIFSSIISKLESITTEFFENIFNGYTDQYSFEYSEKNMYTKLDSNPSKKDICNFLHYINIDQNFTDKFTNIDKPETNPFIQDNIEWILKCYNNEEFRLYEFDDENFLFVNYKKFLKLYMELRFLLLNSEELYVIKKRQLYLEIHKILKDTGKITDDSTKDEISEQIKIFKKTPEGEELVKSINSKYYIIRDDFKQGKNNDYILGYKQESSEQEQETKNNSRNTKLTKKLPKEQKEVVPKTKKTQEEIAELKAISKTKKTNSKQPQTHAKKVVYEPIFDNLYDLIEFTDSYKTEIKEIKDILINNELKKCGFGKENIHIELKTNKLYVYRILTKPGSLLYGSSTSWCTATKSPQNMFDKYKSEGNIYIIQKRDVDGKDNNETIYKDEDYTDEDYKLQKSTDKFQIQVETKQIMNNEDKPVTIDFINNFFKDEKLKDFLNSIFESLTNIIFEYDIHENKLSIECNDFIEENQALNLIKTKLDEYESLESLNLMKFNYPLGNLLDNLVNLDTLVFGDEFNKDLGNSLYKLVKLKTLFFGKKFNKPLGNSLDKLENLKELVLGDNFDQLIGNSLDKLENLNKLNLGGYTGNIDDLNKITKKILSKIILLTMIFDDDIDYLSFLQKLSSLQLLYLNNFNNNAEDKIKIFTEKSINKIEQTNLNIIFDNKTVDYYKKHILKPILDSLYTKRTKKINPKSNFNENGNSRGSSSSNNNENNNKNNSSSTNNNSMHIKFVKPNSNNSPSPSNSPRPINFIQRPRIGDVRRIQRRPAIRKSVLKAIPVPTIPRTRSKSIIFNSDAQIASNELDLNL